MMTQQHEQRRATPQQKPDAWRYWREGQQNSGRFYYSSTKPTDPNSLNAVPLYAHPSPDNAALVEAYEAGWKDNRAWRAKGNADNPEVFPEALPKNLRAFLERKALTASPRQYGDDWGPWKVWKGDSDYGPNDLEIEELVYVSRRGPNATHYTIAERHHIDWLHTGGPEDVMAYRRNKALSTVREPAQRYRNERAVNSSQKKGN